MGSALNPRPGSGSPPALEPKARPFDSPPEAVDQKYFRRIVELCASRKISVALVTTPVYETTATSKGYRDAVWLDATARASGLLRLDYTAWRHRADTGYFHDSTHLNADGAIPFNLELAEDLPPL